MGYYSAVCIHFSEDCKKSFDAYINSLSEKDISKLSEKYTDVYFSEYSLEELRNEVFHFLETATTRCKHLEEVVYIWDCVKWYKDYPPVAIIEDFFKKSEYSTFAFARMGENGEDIESNDDSVEGEKYAKAIEDIANKIYSQNLIPDIKIEQIENNVYAFNDKEVTLKFDENDQLKLLDGTDLEKWIINSFKIQYGKDYF